MEEEREKAMMFLRTMKSITESIDWFSVINVYIDVEDDSKVTKLIGGGGQEIIDREPTFERVIIIIDTKPGKLPVPRKENGLIERRTFDEEESQKQA